MSRPLLPLYRKEQAGRPTLNLNPTPYTMNFLEKDLETIIWENYERCAEKGLDIGQAFYAYGKAYRQMNLAPYGIADLVYIRFAPRDNLYYVQVIELKRGKIDSAAYLQAKRYQTAVFGLLDRLRKREGLDFKVALSSVLIGNEVELSGDFVFALNTDDSCAAYTYSFDGIAFRNEGREWSMKGAVDSAALRAFDADLMAHRADAAQGWREYIENQNREHMEGIEAHGDWSNPLVITADGVLFNEDLLEEDLNRATEDGAE
jgi:hypothetical protein